MYLNNDAKSGQQVRFLKGGGAKLIAAAMMIGALPSFTEAHAQALDNNIIGLTRVENAGDNTITKFEYNEETALFDPTFYEFNIQKTEYGSGDTTLNFGWEADENGNFTFTQNPTNPVEPQIIYKYDSTAPSKEAMTVTTDISDTPVEGNFIGLDATAIQNGNSGKMVIGDINANFINNSGHAISSARPNSRIGDITGDFVGNYGGIYNTDSEIGNIRGNFIGNTVAEGAVIYNAYVASTPGVISSISGNFIGNTSILNDGAIYNRSGSIGSISGNFIGNIGGAISNINSGGSINSISGNFINNYKKSYIDREGESSVMGGAIYNDFGVIDTARSLYTSPKYMKITMTNTTNGESITLYSFDRAMTEEELNAYFASGGKVVMMEMSQSGEMSDEEWTAMKEQIASGALGNATTEPIDIPEENLITTDSLLSKAPIHDSLFIGNHVKSDTTEALGGAIYNSGQIGNSISGQDNISEELKEVFVDIDFNKLSDSTNPSITNSSFYNNYAESETGTAKGGAIYSTTDLTIAADNGESIFSGNKVINNGVEESNAIYIEAGQYETPQYDEDLDTTVNTVDDTTLTLNATNGGLIYFDDKIAGSAGTTGRYYEERQADGSKEQIWLEKTENNRYNVELKGDGTGKIVFNNDVENADIFLNDGAITYLGRESVWDTSNLTFNGGSLSLLNNTVGTANFDSLSIAADTDVTVDVDLANSAMDRITADSYGEMNGNLNVVGMNLLSDSAEEQTEILFADTNLKDHVTYGGNAEIPDDFQTTAYTPIYKYNVSYDNKDDGGYFLFNRGNGGSGSGSDNFNPAVLSTTVANQAAGQSALNEVFKYSYEHVDSFTKLPSFERMAKINANKYAMSTDFNENMPMFAEQLYNKGVWFKPFTTFENIDLKNGPDVDAITYGTLVGFDTDFHEHRNGWHSVFSGFAGYVGSSLNYSGVDSTMNGGILGFTETFYKGNFWTAISATAGASVGESHNMYGKEDYTSLLAGVSSKTGYNFEFKNGKFIVQPIMYLGYTFVNTFDYKNSAGVNIDSDPLHTIQLNPSVRFIANLKNGWQPYASVGMVWNLMNESKATANNVRLPEMSVKPYVEYGVGVQRNWADKYTGYLQAMVRNGGRTGVSLTGGFRFMLGDETKVTPETPKKDIKSL